MNGKTASLIDSYATHTDQSSRELKREWNKMSKRERQLKRASMKAELGRDTKAE